MNRRFRAIEAAVACVAFATAAPGAAQVVLDGTLPNGRTDVLVGPSYSITEDLGYRNGVNLFHSFYQFDVGAGESATFSAIMPTANVIARVTSYDPGSGQAFPQASQIDGRVGFDASLGNANFFFVNPAGVVFGPSAEVAVSGAAFASTADYLRFDDPDSTVVDSSSPSVNWNGLMLETAAPAAFGFLGGLDAGDVSFNGDPDSFSALTYQGSGFTAVGGDVTMTQAISAPGATVQLAAVGSATLEVPVDLLQFDALSGDAAALGEVSILPTTTTVASIDTTDFSSPSAAQGRIVIRGGRFTAEGANVILLGGGGAPGAEAAIDIEVAGDAAVRDGAQIAALGISATDFGAARLAAGGLIEIDGATVASQAEGSGTGGGVQLSGSAVDLLGGAQVLTVSNAGSAGDIVVQAFETVAVEASTMTTTTGAGSAGGSIDIVAGALDVRAGGTISTSSSSSAMAGGIGIAATTVTVRQAGSSVSTLNQIQTPGDPTLAAGGDISIDTSGGSVFVTSGGSIATQTNGTRRGGEVGIVTAALVVSDGGLIETSTTGAGGGGGVDVEATDILVQSTLGSAEVSQMSALVAQGATGAGGSMLLTTDTLRLVDGGQIRTTTRGDATIPGDAEGGDITVRATGAVELIGGNRLSPTDLRPSGLFARSGAQNIQTLASGGSIDVEAASIAVLDGAEVSTRTFGAGAAGSIRLHADGVLQVAGAGEQAATVSARGLDGDGGNIRLEGQSVLLLDGGSVSVSTNGAGAGGLLSVAADVLLVASDAAGVFRSGLAAEAFGTGSAGGIDIDVAGSVTVQDGGSITARSTSDGSSGSVIIRDAGAVTLRGGEISARAEGAAAGGNVSITSTGPVTLDRGRITAESSSGAGGSVTLQSDTRITLADGSEISARAAGSDPAGDISLTTDGFVSLESGSLITAEATGSGDAGSIVLNSGRRLDVFDSAITTQAAPGLGGNIEVQAIDRVYLVSSEISTSVKTGQGSGGNIDIDPQFVVLNASRIVAEADEGAGGNITIIAQNYLRSGDSLVSASSHVGIDGTVLVTTPESQLAGQIGVLPENLLDATALLEEACLARDAPVGSFSVGIVKPLEPPDAPLGPDTGEAAACSSP